MHVNWLSQEGFDSECKGLSPENIGYVREFNFLEHNFNSVKGPLRQRSFRSVKGISETAKQTFQRPLDGRWIGQFNQSQVTEHARSRNYMY